MNSGDSMHEISQIIKKKEAELHTFFENRTKTLELMISERDALLIDFSKKFEQMKEDFQYNLSLLEDRDRYIEKLNLSCEAFENENIKLKDDLKKYVNQIEQLEQRNATLIEKSSSDKAKHKVRYNLLASLIGVMNSLFCRKYYNN